MLATILALTGCPGPVNNYIEPVHEHVFGDWSDWEVVTAATCTEDGSKKRTHTCSCGEVEEETTVIAALGHDFGEWSNWTVTKVLTYNQDEEKEHTHTCTRCGHSEKETVVTSRFVAGGYDGDIPTDVENPETYRYQYEDGYKIELNVCTLEEYNNAGDDKTAISFSKKYISFPNNIEQLKTILGRDDIVIDEEEGLSLSFGEVFKQKLEYSNLTFLDNDNLEIINNKTENMEVWYCTTQVTRLYIVIE